MEHNNVKGFDKDWEGGGMKIAVARDGVVRRCRAVANNGVGLWFDIDVRDVVVENCFCSENAGHGIFVEISGGFTIRSNLCIGNGTDDAWGQAGIAIGESDHTTIENNTAALAVFALEGDRALGQGIEKTLRYHAKCVREAIEQDGGVFSMEGFALCAFHFGSYAAEHFMTTQDEQWTHELLLSQRQYQYTWRPNDGLRRR